MSESAAIDVLPLTPDRFTDLAALFEEGGDPKWCWCTYFRCSRTRLVEFDGGGQSRRVEGAHQAQAKGTSLPASSRTGTTVPSAGSASRRARTTSASPPRRSSLRSTTSRSGRSSASSSSRRSRRQGVAAALLDAAIDYARSHGATTLEAYPVEVPTGERIPSANAYHGTLTMFERAGFTVVERRQWNRHQPRSPDRPPRPVAPSPGRRDYVIRRDPDIVVRPG